MQNVEVALGEHEGLSIEFSLSGPLVKESWDLTHYLTEISAKVSCPNGNGELVEVAYLNAELVDYDSTFFDGTSIHQVCDDSSNLLDARCAVFDIDTEELRLDLPVKCNGISRLLLLDKVRVEPKFRGRNIGLALAARTIETFATNDTLVVISPYPIEKREGIALASARGRLRRYWKKLNLRRIPGTNHYVWTGECGLPGLVTQGAGFKATRKAPPANPTTDQPVPPPQKLITNGRPTVRRF